MKQQKLVEQDAIDIEEIKGLLTGAQSAPIANATASSAAVKLNAILKKRRGT